jgi:hypothetical protein
VSAGQEGPAEWAWEKQYRQERREEGAIEVREQPNSMMQVVKDAAESFGDKPLEAQPVHKVDRAKPGEQED